MVLYLLNATLIWLVSLIFFDLFLKKETFHSANRIYLNATLLLGLLLPLLSFTDNHTATMMAEPVKKVYSFKSSVVKAADIEPYNHTWGIVETLWLLYFMGVCIMLVVMVKEAIVIMRLYKNGTKEKHPDYTLVETHQPHSPFSFGGKLFLQSKEAYSEEQLQMILEHELNHTSKKHLFDKIFFAIIKIALWFHPLIYMYYSRLMLLHEYEADTTVRKNIPLYGNFLIEQSFLQSHTLVTHSFNHSPIKNRIIMLTKNKSSRIKLFKYTLMLPMLLVFLVCCTQKMQTQKLDKERIVKDNKVTFRGNEFEFSKKRTDSIFVEDPATGETTIVLVRIEPYPVKMNNEKIYNTDEVTKKTSVQSAEGNAGVYFLQKLHDNFSSLKNGKYSVMLSYVVDANGKIVFYDSVFVHDNKVTFEFAENSDGKEVAIAQDKEAAVAIFKKKNNKDEQYEAEKARLAEKIESLMDDMHFVPAQVNGKNVISFVNDQFSVSITDGVASLGL